jgi:hypothetical protein
MPHPLATPATLSVIPLASGDELLLDDRMRTSEPGWFLCGQGREPEAVSVAQALRLAQPEQIRHVVSLTVALLGELHLRSIAPTTTDPVPSDAYAGAKHRLTKQLADAVHRLVRTSDA